MSPLFDKTALLPEELGMYVDTVRKRYPAIDQVWLLGLRGDGDRHAARGGRPEGAWSLLAFGDESVLDELRRDVALHRDDVEFLVVTDGDRFAAAWGDRPAGRLAEFGWRLENPQAAVYDDADAEDGHAVATRVR